MASIFFSKAHAKWRCKWRARDADRKPVWKTVTLCSHPGWVKGRAVPKRPCPEAAKLFRAYEDKELEANHGVTVADIRPWLLADFLNGYFGGTDVSHTEGSRRLVRHELDRFLAWCAERDPKITTVAEVTTEICRLYVADLLRQLARNTVTTAKGVLAAPWSLAYADRKIPQNPWHRLKIPGKPREEKPPFWTEEEIRRLRAVSPQWLADIIAVGFGSGVRISALLGLKWGAVNFATQTLHVLARESKSGRHYDAPTIGDARDVLARKRHEDKEDGLVFQRADGEPIISQATYQRIKSKAKAAGIKDHGHYNHILRHSFATWAVSKGVPLKIVSQWLGHASVAMTEKYAHANPVELQRWADNLTDLTTGDGTESHPAKSPCPDDVE